MADRPQYPAWRYGPNGEARIFEKDDVVPAGWTDHPDKHKQAKDALKKSAKGQRAPEPEPTPEEKAETIRSLREAGVEIRDDASVDEINAAIDKLTNQQGS